VAFVRFGSTLWTLVDGARAGDRPALDRIGALYRPPIVNFAQRQGLTADEAEDAAQETLVRLFAALRGADPSKGKFRSLVLGIARNVIFETFRKRGRPVPLSPQESVDDREESFDRAWVNNIVLVALDRLRRECEARKTPFYEALRGQMEGKPHDEIAQALGVEAKQVKSYVHQARQKVRRAVEESIAEYTVEHEYEEERRYLLRLLDG
jgi:RNA polymerase sigma-70 factor, ECF subfamily